MNIKKLETILLSVGFTFFVGGFVVFFLIPTICGGTFDYDPLQAFLNGAKEFATLNGGGAIYLVIRIVLLFAVVVALAWALTVMIKGQKRHIAPSILIVLCAAAVCVLLSTYLVALNTLNGEEGRMLKMVLNLDAHKKGKLLTLGSLGLVGLSVITFLIYAFLTFADTVSAKPEPAPTPVQEVKEEPVAVEEPAKEEPKEEEPKKLDETIYVENVCNIENSTFEERKEREEKLFAEMVATGEYEEYDEVAFKEPLEGEYHEEPIFESVDYDGELKVEEKVVAAPKAEPAPAPAPAPVVVPVAEPVPAQKVERIPFAKRLHDADKALKAAYNELKSEILSYGIKSRISNSGDTFRLHTKTYVKIVVAGKSLKLYMALNPADYKDSTYPIGDASSKANRQDTPLVFKVKSDLSVRRAKTLIADCAAKDGLVQGEVVAYNHAKEVK